MNRLFAALCLTFFTITIAVSTAANAQNLLQNGGFESSNAPIHGDNLGTNISPWEMAQRPVSSDPNYFWEVSVMKLNSLISNFALAMPNSVKNTPYFGYVNLLPNRDASNATSGNAIRLHYSMDGGAHTFKKLSQRFIAPRNGCVRWGFSAFNFTRKIKGVSFSLYKVTDSSIADINAHTSYFSGPGVQSISRSLGQPILVSGQWQNFSKVTEVEAGQEYFLTTWPYPGFALDNIFVRYINRLSCLSPVANSAGSLKPINLPNLPAPTAVVKKTCNAPVLGNNNGTQGYFWNCNIAIQLSSAPFNGTFTLHENALMSNGSSVFTSSPAGCIGTGSSNLICTINGALMGSPHIVPVQLFTPVPANALPVAWKNCASGTLTANGSNKKVKASCVKTVLIHKDKPKPLPEPEKLSLKKSCKKIDSVFDGKKVAGWKCEVTVTANPAPFSGSFTFTEDASAVTGAVAANIVGITPGNWQCTPSAPTLATNCTILGANFNPSGVETVSFELFAPFTGQTIDWENCVNGFYKDPEGNKKPVKGNCEATTWKPDFWKSPTKPTPTTPQCDKRTTYKKGGKCACRFGRAKKISATACACPRGTRLNAKRGRCQKILRCIKPAKLSRKGTSCLCPRGWRPNGRNGCRKVIVCKKPARANRKGTACLCPRGWRPDRRNGCRRKQIIRLCVPPARPIAGVRGCRCPRGWVKTSPFSCGKGRRPPKRPDPAGHPKPNDDQPKKGGFVIKPFG